MPLVNEVVNPIKDKDKFNASSPWNDAQFLEERHQARAAEAHRGDLQDQGPDGAAQRPRRRLPERRRGPQPAAARDARRSSCASTPPSSRAKTPKRLGVLDGDNAGFPNGRRLTDDVLDIALQVVEGELRRREERPGRRGRQERQEVRASPSRTSRLPTAGSRGPLAKGNTDEQRPQRDRRRGCRSGGTDDTTLIAASAGAGAAGVLLIGSGLLWWRRRNDRAYY